MKRRGFLSALLLTAPIAASALPSTQPQADEFEFMGYRIKWRNYVHDTYTDDMIGVWIAHRPETFPNYDLGHGSLISSPAGGCVAYGPAFVMSNWDKRLSFRSTPKQLADAKVKALDDLKKFILDNESNTG